jgi:hypothetical protein
MMNLRVKRIGDDQQFTPPGVSLKNIAGDDSFKSTEIGSR